MIYHIKENNKRLISGTLYAIQHIVDHLVESCSVLFI